MTLNAMDMRNLMTLNDTIALDADIAKKTRFIHNHDSLQEPRTVKMTRSSSERSISDLIKRSGLSSILKMWEKVLPIVPYRPTNC